MATVSFTIHSDYVAPKRKKDQIALTERIARQAFETADSEFAPDNAALTQALNSALTNVESDEERTKKHHGNVEEESDELQWPVIRRPLPPPPVFVPASSSQNPENFIHGERHQKQKYLEEGENQQKGSNWYQSLPRVDTGSTGPVSSSSRSKRLCATAPDTQGHKTTYYPSMPRQWTSQGITKNDWFIRRALRSSVTASTSTSNVPLNPSPAFPLKVESRLNTMNPTIKKALAPKIPVPPSLADILTRNPPPLPYEPKYEPPVFLSIGPSNKGFAMLEKRGWKEGEALGLAADRIRKINRERGRRGGLGFHQAPVVDMGWLKIDTCGKELLSNESTRGRGKLGPFANVKKELKPVASDDDEVVELRNVDVIDLTMSDEEEGSTKPAYHPVTSLFIPEYGDASPSVPLSCNRKKEADDFANDPEIDDVLFDDAAPSTEADGYERKALVTPLPTTLKFDRLGIGLKAKVSDFPGPYGYREPRRRITHNIAASLRHAIMNEEAKRRRERIGKGKRGYERAYKKEQEKRKTLLASMNE